MRIRLDSQSVTLLGTELRGRFVAMVYLGVSTGLSLNNRIIGQRRAARQFRKCRYPPLQLCSVFAQGFWHATHCKP